MKPEEQNKAVIRKMFAAAERDGLTAQATFFADRLTNHGMSVDRDSVRAILQDIATTFSDANFEMINLIAEADWVVVQCLLRGTHSGVGKHPFVHDGLLTGVPPTGKSICVQHIHMFRLQDGQIVEHWANRDDVLMMRQLGLFEPVATSTLD
jgi:predicted ester cyclase